jgi:hypothetical protein
MKTFIVSVTRITTEHCESSIEAETEEAALAAVLDDYENDDCGEFDNNFSIVNSQVAAVITQQGEGNENKTL